MPVSRTGNRLPVMRRPSFRVFIFTSFLIFFLYTFFEFRKPVSVFRVVAEINEEKVTWGDFQAFTSDVAEDELTPQYKRTLLDNLVIQRAVLRMVRKNHYREEEIDRRIASEEHYAYINLVAAEFDNYVAGASDDSTVVMKGHRMAADFVRDIGENLVLDDLLLKSFRVMSRDTYTGGGFDSQPVAWFGNTKDVLTFGEFYGTLRDLYLIDDLSLLTDKRLVQYAIDIAINRRKFDFAVQRNLDKTIPFRIKWEREKMRLADTRPAKIVTYLSNILADTDLKITDDELMAYYEAHKEEFRMPDWFRYRQILCFNKADALSVMDELRAGAKFEDLVPIRSKERNVQYTGGLSPSVSREVLKNRYPLFAKHKVGEIIGPLDNGRDYAIYKIVERIPGALPSFGRVKPDLTTRLRQEKWFLWLEQTNRANKTVIKKYYHLLDEPEPETVKKTGFEIIPKYDWMKTNPFRKKLW